MGSEPRHLDRAETRVGRKPQSTGPRSIAKLTPGQLARKREADRAGQRILRERRRERIQQLEHRIRELGEAADELEIQALQRRNEELEEEVRELKAILERLQRKGSGSDSHESSSSNVKIEPTITSHDGTQTFQAGSTIIFSNNTYILPSGRTKPEPPITNTSSGVKTSSILPDDATLNQVSYPDTPPVSLQIIDPNNQTRYVMPAKAQTSQFKASRARTKASNDGSTQMTIMSQNRYRSLPSLTKQPSIHIWELPPAIRTPDNPIDKIFYGLVQHQRALFAKGVTGKELAGPQNPSMSILVTPERSHNVHIVARVICELLDKITYRTFIDKLGAFTVIYRIYQWLIMRSYQTYSNIPSWSRPVLAQRTTPHAIWISALGTPELKQKVIENQEKYDTEEFQFMFVASINVNWPHGIERALTWEDGEVRLSQEFWEHARDRRNFTLDEPFQSRYPELRDFAPFTKYD